MQEDTNPKPKQAILPFCPNFCPNDATATARPFPRAGAHEIYAFFAHFRIVVVHPVHTLLPFRPICSLPVPRAVFVTISAVMRLHGIDGLDGVHFRHVVSYSYIQATADGANTVKDIPTSLPHRCLPISFPCCQGCCSLVSLFFFRVASSSQKTNVVVDVPDFSSRDKIIGRMLPSAFCFLCVALDVALDVAC